MLGYPDLLLTAAASGPALFTHFLTCLLTYLLNQPLTYTLTHSPYGYVKPTKSRVRRGHPTVSRRAIFDQKPHFYRRLKRLAVAVRVGVTLREDCTCVADGLGSQAMGQESARDTIAADPRNGS